MSGDPTDFRLKHTNVSRPRLSHSDSQQSVAASLAASDGYYSAPEKTSGDSDSDGDGRAPSSHAHLLSPPHAPITSLRGVGIPRQHHDRPRAPVDESPAPPPRQPQPRPNMEPDSQPTTPGQDTTPYIRFAIDQLTRDEEVRGSRIYPHIGSADDDDNGDGDSDYPVERIVPDNGLGYMDREHEAQQKMPQHVSPKPPRQIYCELHPPHAKPSTPQAPKDAFVAHDQPPSPLRFRPAILRTHWLAFFAFLCILMLAGLVFSAVYSNRNGGSGLWEYLQFGDGRYFVFQYLPTILGMALLLWLIQVQTALQRMIPFISLASKSPHQRSEAAFLQLYPTQFLLPNFEHFRAGFPLVGTCYFVFWLFTWTIPLLAASFNVRYDEERRVWIWVAVQGVIWTVAVLYILLILALVFLIVFLMRNETGLRWDPRSLADIISLFERSNVTADYDGSETFQKGDWYRLRNPDNRIGYWSTTNHPSDIFYGIGKEGGLTTKSTVEERRIKERAPKRAPELAHGNERPNDFSIRMDIRSSEVRLKYLHWYLKDTMVVAWIVTAVILLVTFLVVSYVKENVRLGFLPQVTARTNTAGFSASNFLYSFVPALIGHFLFLAMLSLDYSLRVLQPYIALSSKGGATAETSLLVDYACRLPFSVTLSAIENSHFQTAILSLLSLASISIPIIAGGCFWTQYYQNDDNVRVAADLPGYYALCVFLVLYTFGLFALLPRRHRAALPHRSNNLAEITSWVYQSPILTDRAFAQPATKPELVARLMGTTYLGHTWTRSVASLVRPSRGHLRGDSATNPMLEDEMKRRAAKGEELYEEPGMIRYGFGIHVGQDGLEHLGIDRVQRGGNRNGRPLVIWEEQQQHKRKSWTEQV